MDFGDYVIKLIGNIIIYVGKQVCIELGFYVKFGVVYYVFIREDCILGFNKFRMGGNVEYNFGQVVGFVD